MKGQVLIELVDVQGLVIDRRETHNLVLTAGYDELIKVLAGDNATSHYINRMQFGTGTSTPTAADTTLAMPISPIKGLAIITHPGLGVFTITIEAFLLSAEGNGFPVSEVGLLTPDSTLSARAIFAPLTKTSDYALHATWQISD